MMRWNGVALWGFPCIEGKNLNPKDPSPLKSQNGLVSVNHAHRLLIGVRRVECDCFLFPLQETTQGSV